MAREIMRDTASLYEAEEGCLSLEGTRTIPFAAIIAVGAVISLICYMLYYKLSATAGFIDGMVPLLMAALVMAGMNLVLLKGKLSHRLS